jgi:hypothetical protein
MKKHGTPRLITLDAYAASHRAITKLKSAGTISHRVGIRSGKYLIPEQRCGAGSLPNQTADSANARIQAIRDSNDNDQRHRACREDSETPVHDWKPAWQTCTCSRHLGSYSRCLPPSTSFQSPDHVHWQSLHQNLDKIQLLFASYFHRPIAREVR